MPEAAGESPRANELGYPDSQLLANQTEDGVLAFIPADANHIGDEAFVVAMPDSHVDVVEVR